MFSLNKTKTLLRLLKNIDYMDDQKYLLLTYWELHV